ncbi:MAG: N-acetylmuramoyl-L-alanine amidase [Planctomycetes bacterium]|nr:N-acetylmuramoyl-L-alanine amidase [Planctomycetota bacterium]
MSSSRTPRPGARLAPRAPVALRSPGHRARASLALILPAALLFAIAPGCHSPRLPDRPRWKPYAYDPAPAPAIPAGEAAPAAPPAVEDLALARSCGLEPMTPALSVPNLFAWRHIVLHHSATEDGSAAKFDAEHKKRGWDGLGYHFVIGNGRGAGDGQIEVGWRWRQQREGAHAGTGNVEYNRYGIGICLVGNFEKKAPSAKQIESCIRLMKYLMARCAIPPKEVVGHKTVRPAPTDCPGRLFPMGDILRRCAEPTHLP